MPSKGSTVKVNGWTAQLPPEEGNETQTYRGFIVEAVRLLYDGEPVSLAMIYTAVKNRVVALMLQKKWVFLGWFDGAGTPHIRSKRWVDRRVNESASLMFGANIVAVRAGYYASAEGEVNEMP